MGDAGKRRRAALCEGTEYQLVDTLRDRLAVDFRAREPVVTKCTGLDSTGPGQDLCDTVAGKYQEKMLMRHKNACLILISLLALCSGVAPAQAAGTPVPAAG